jgi:uncharacterized protein YndB with AHSA1/START domain
LTPSICRETVFPASPTDVWRALTDAAALAEWFANEVELEARPGGTGIFRWHDGSERRATVELVDRERAFGFSWHDEQGRMTRVRLTLDEADEGTRLTVTETPVEPRAAALVGEWSWGVQLLAALPRLRRLAPA